MESIKTKSALELEVWERLRLVVGDDREAGEYDARVEDFINGGILITSPEYVSGNTRLRQNMVIRVQITREDAVYEFGSQIRLRNDNSSRSAILTPPRQFRRVQRRQFARVEISTPVEFACSPQRVSPTEWDEKLVWQQGRTVNISAGGLLMVSEEEIPAKAVVALRIRDGGEGLPQSLIAVACRSYLVEGKHHCGLRFCLVRDLNDHFKAAQVKLIPESFKQFHPNSQDQLVTHLFQKQIELRQKGLL